MEVSGYEVKVLGGRHFSKPEIHSTPSPSRLEDFPRSLLYENFPRSPYCPYCGGYAKSSCDNDCQTKYCGLCQREFYFRGKGHNPNCKTISSVDKSYVEMRDGDHYRLQLKNNHNTRCNATVYIDGKKVGTWRIAPYSSIKIERPVEVDKKFTFYKIYTGMPNGTGLKRGDPNNGLIRVEFTPEYEPPFEICNEDCYNDDSFAGSRRGGAEKSYHPQSRYTDSVRPDCMAASANGLVMSNSSHCQGGTALRGKSYQEYGHAEIIVVDNSKSVTVNLRLVAKRHDDRDRSFYNRVTPLGSRRSNPVPPPVTFQL